MNDYYLGTKSLGYLLNHFSNVCSVLFVTVSKVQFKKSSQHTLLMTFFVLLSYFYSLFLAYANIWVPGNFQLIRKYCND